MGDTHDQLVEQAETVLSATQGAMYDVASAEAYRLQEMLDEEQSAD